MSNGLATRQTMTQANYPMPYLACPHPNEFDLRRIARLLAQRVRYRYVEPEVQAIAGGYQIVSPCCSRNIDASGGTIDIARLEYVVQESLWRLYYKDHQRNMWQLHLEAPKLKMLITQLNEDPLRIFWQ
ncbi:DUF3024 domain-containing protein [Sulfuriferula nivalis]|uniref:DUF3024 domain-containing protein n=1 Tax=Sulfuriferula nivalis TaxID=2675298 RepID=A0A809RDE7_9PROT|nr:DUF3024 domain-containing protein [Sulfuriferula nivalis]BBO99664.1 hypothetical protein SFSGTM_03730 [Sulfuriferula nivalis]